MNIKTRKFPESNYSSVWMDGTTLRFAIDPSKPMTELEYPEFYDVKITNNCLGRCPYCYMDSKKDEPYDDIVGKIDRYFGSMTENQRPFQIAYGGGEPTTHPDFVALLRKTKELGICPNYTTNGMFVDERNADEIVEATLKYCGGVALSCHPHLDETWKKAVERFSKTRMKANLHLIVSDKESIERFVKIHEELHDRVDRFVLLPYVHKGRAVEKGIDWDFLVESLPEDRSQLAFGAHFYENLKKRRDLNVSLYEPELMSKFLDLKGHGCLYPSSFSDEVLKTDLF